MHLDYPVAEAFDDEVFHDGMIAIHRIATAGVICVFAARSQHIIDGIIEPSKCYCRTAFVALATVIENDVEDDFDLCLVKGFDHGSEFFDSCAGGGVCGITLIRAKEADRRVAPIICMEFARIGIA